ncbi:MAG TPA: outer membrane protein assembly factor, partial [Azonexus sp.]|nr:outer membrane protein assembly factor [Azonexus sp.]
MLSRQLLPSLLLTLATSLMAGEVVLQAPDEITNLLTPYLPEEAGNPRRLEGQLSAILATEGYFSPHFEFSDSTGDLRLKLDPGPRTQIGEVAVVIDGPLAAKTRDALIAGWRLPVGQPFRQ